MATDIIDIKGSFEIPTIEGEVSTQMVSAKLGLTGPKGDKGDTGSTGAGFPTGGSVGQIVVKLSGTNYDASWQDYYKQLAANPDSIIAGSITRDANEAVTSAAVVWPDGTSGTFTADTLSSSFPGAVDAYHITYGSKTYTQSAVTRDSAGAVTNRPAITVA